MMEATSTAREHDLLTAAIGYASRSLLVFPVGPRAKKPLTQHGFKDATKDAKTIRAWWTRWPDANIGIAIPPQVIVLDLDDHEALNRLKALDLVLPSTARAATGRGKHVWYRTPGQQARNTVALLPKVDVRAHGGYVVAPPSVHPSGAVYRWEVELTRSNVADAPEWLLKRLQSSERSTSGRPDSDWERAVAEIVPAGRRNQALAKMAGLLFRRLPANVAAELATCWARARMSPPLPDREVQRTLDSIASLESRRLRGQR